MTFDPRGFKKLVNKILPKRLGILRNQIKQAPITLNNLTPQNMKKIRERLGVTKGDAPGCYIFVSYGKPFYVGISRKVLTRLRQHVKGSSHFDASLAFMMAKENSGLRKGVTRSAAMRDKTFKRAFDKAKANLLKANVVCIGIKSPEERYLFEIYAAMELKTSKWNSFDTH